MTDFAVIETGHHHVPLWSVISAKSGRYSIDGVFTNKGGQQRALFRRGRSTEGAFSKRAVNRGRFFEEGGQQRALFRRGRSTEAAFSKRAVNRGRFFEEDDQQRARGIDGGQQKAPLLRRAIFLRARAVKVRPALLAERAVRSRALLFMRTPVRRALSQLP